MLHVNSRKTEDDGCACRLCSATFLAPLTLSQPPTCLGKTCPLEVKSCILHAPFTLLSNSTKTSSISTEPNYATFHHLTQLNSIRSKQSSILIANLQSDQCPPVVTYNRKSWTFNWIYHWWKKVISTKGAASAASHTPLIRYGLH